MNPQNIAGKKQLTSLQLHPVLLTAVHAFVATNVCLIRDKLSRVALICTDVLIVHLGDANGLFW